MSPLNLIQGHPYYLLNANGTETQLLYIGTTRGNHGVMYDFKCNRYDHVQLDTRQVEQLLFR